MSKSIEPRERVLRVFISSTFRDMHADRDELVKRVFPQIRRLCEERGVIWSEVDLRWGVTDEQKAEGRVLPICLAEIDRCRPYFISLLGERYGWVPDEISPSLISSQPWMNEHRERSVTELEILHGVFNDPAMVENAYFYFRDPAYIESLPVDQRSAFLEVASDDEIQRLGRDAANRQAEVRRAKLVELKDRIRGSRYPVREGYTGARQLGEWVLKDLTELIDHLFPVTAKRDQFAQLSFENLAFARQQLTTYVPRRELDEVIEQHFLQDSVPLVLVGDTGTGKSATLARWFASVSASTEATTRSSWWQWLTGRVRDKHTPIVIGHFAGATSDSTDWTVVVRRILAELKRRCRVRWSIPDNPADLRFALVDWLPLLPVHAPVLIVLDGVDQLEHGELQADLGWLPTTFPENVRLAVSTRPGPVLQTLQSRQWTTRQVPPLTTDERDLLIVSFLRSSGKELSVTERQRIARAAPSGNPLFLRILLDELRLFGEHERLTDRIGRYLQARHVSDLYSEVLQRYEVDYEEDHPGLIRDCLSLLWGSHRGLAESELLELLGSRERPLPQIYWSRVNLAAGQSLLSRSGHWTFANGAFRDAVRRRYLEDPAQRRTIHARLASYFGPPTPFRRRLDEQLWQLAQSEQWTELAAAVTDIDLIQTAVNSDNRTAQPLRQALMAINGQVDPGSAFLKAADLWIKQRGRTSEVADTFLMASRLLHEFGDSRSAEQLVERSAAMRGTTRKVKADRSLDEVSQLGRAQQVQDKLAEAMETYRRGEQMAVKGFGKNSAEAAIFRGSVAGILHLQGLDSEAVPIYEQALRTLEKAYGEEDEQVLLLKANLALSYADLGRHQEALGIYEQVLQISERLTDPSSESVTGTLMNLASLHWRMGHVAKSIELGQRALVVRERALGGDHPRVGNILHNLAMFYAESGMPQRAVPLLERTLEIARRTRGENHSDFAITAAALGETFRQTGQFEKSEMWSRRAIELLQLLPIDRSYLIKVRKNLGLLYLQQKRFGEALAEEEEAAAMQISAFGEHHEETARVYLNLGEVHFQQGDLAKAQHYFEKGVATYAVTLGDHREHVGALMRLEAIARQLGDTTRADELQLAGKAMLARLGLSLADPAAKMPPQLSPPTPPSAVDSVALQNARDAIRRQFEEIGQLARSQIRPSNFFVAWLDRVVPSLAAHGGAVWMIDSLGRLILEAEYKLPPECRTDSPCAAAHEYMLRWVSENSHVAVAPGAWLPNAPESQNPTPYLLLLTTLTVPGQGKYIAEIVQRANCAPAVIHGFSAYVIEVCKLLQHYLANHAATSPH